MQILQQMLKLTALDLKKNAEHFLMRHNWCNVQKYAEWLWAEHQTSSTRGRRRQTDLTVLQGSGYLEILLREAPSWVKKKKKRRGQRLLLLWNERPPEHSRHLSPYA